MGQLTREERMFYISSNFKNYTFCLYGLHFCRNYQMLRQIFEHGGSKNNDISEKLGSFHNVHGYKD